jgi:hypothetical protein
MKSSTAEALEVPGTASFPYRRIPRFVSAGFSRFILSPVWQ